MVPGRVDRSVVQRQIVSCGLFRVSHPVTWPNRSAAASSIRRTCAEFVSCASSCPILDKFCKLIFVGLQK